MSQNSHFHHGLHGPQRETLLRWAGLAQWFGLVMLLLTIGLAALTDSVGDSQGLGIITLCAALGLVAIVGARLVIGHYQGDAPDDADKPD